VEVGIADHEFAGSFFKSGLSEMFDAKEVFVFRTDLEALDVVPVVDAMANPGSDFAVNQFRAVEGREDVGSEIRPENGEGFSMEGAAVDGFEEEVHLKLGIEPALFEAWPRAGGEYGRGGILGVVLGKAHGRAIEGFMVKLGLDALHGFFEVRLAFEFQVTPPFGEWLLSDLQMRSL
jgi:hypothetical protein